MVLYSLYGPLTQSYSNRGALSVEMSSAENQLADYRLQHRNKRRRTGEFHAQSQSQPQWICPLCTLLNEPTAVTCAVCLAERPDIAAATASAIAAASTVASQAGSTSASASQAATHATAAPAVDAGVQRSRNSAGREQGDSRDCDHDWREQLLLPPTAPLPPLSSTARSIPMCRSLTVLSWNISDFTELCSSQAPASWTAEENRAALHCVLCRAVALPCSRTVMA